MTTLRVPPPPDMPVPPPFGWITEYKGLTPNESQTIKQLLGVDSFEDADGPHFAALVAVAYARRYDPERYPWSCALDIPLSELTPPETTEEERAEAIAEHASKAAEALITGEDEPLDPGSPER